MTLHEDVAILREFLTHRGTTEKAWNALERIEKNLPAQTALEQFQEFPVGRAFTSAYADKFTFVKTGANSVTRVHKATGEVSYFDHVDIEFGWSHPSVNALIPAENY